MNAQGQHLPGDFIRTFDTIGIADVPSVGGKNASLGEMYCELRRAGINVPDGFAITAGAYRHFLRTTGLDLRIARLLEGLDTRNVAELRSRGSRIREAILAAELPADLQEQIIKAYDHLCRSAGSATALDVAVRSSATAEDLPDASFAGQQETYLNVQGTAALMHTVKRCFASLFTDRAISYRTDKGFDQLAVALSVGVQRMVRSDLAVSGVMFTLDTESGFRDVVLINAAYGLGENVVQGVVNPDEYRVFKLTLSQGRPILGKKLGTKELKLVYDVGGGKMVKNVPVPPEDATRFAITDDEILLLATWACLIEGHYTAKRGCPTPMDIEWAKDGVTGDMFIVQARPETVQSQRDPARVKTYKLRAPGRILVSGSSVGSAIAQGPVRVIKDAQFLNQVKEGDVLVTDKTDPDWEPVMKRAAAVITNRGGRTCHAAIVSRELGLPAIVGTGNATEVLHDGTDVTVSCAEGDVGHVYQGRLPYDVETTNLRDLHRPKTRVMMNVGNPEEAMALSSTPNDGVGLAREEFIISSYIKIHPLALIGYDELTDPTTRAAIDILTAGYRDKPQFFVDKLAEGAATIAAAFYPKDVILRLSDFKTNEYANLIGGKAYEPIEENPMIGFRGASRYYDPRYADGFALECRAVRKVRDDMGLKNLKVMIPFCRTVEEGRLVQAEMARHGLRRGEDGLEIYMMCEIPSNVILAAEFAEIFDERNPAVKKMIAEVIRVAKAKGLKIGICGQAPSDYPEFAQFLVEQGIDSISLNPDAVLKTTRVILEAENHLSDGIDAGGEDDAGTTPEPAGVARA